MGAFLLPFVAAGAVAVVVATHAFGDGGGGGGSAAGTLGNSRADAAILEVDDLAPGDSRSRTVTISNERPEPTAIELVRGELRERPGHGGGHLSRRLVLRVDELAGEEPCAMVFRGSPAALSKVRLGRFAGGEARTYRFTASFPEGGARSAGSLPDNDYMGGSVRVEFLWGARS